MLELFGKKAMQSYMMILLIFSVIMTGFITFVIGSVYGVEHADCKLVDFEIRNMCKKSSSAQFNIDNNAQKGLSLKINGKKNSEYFLPANSEKLFNAISENGKIELLPYIDYGGKTYECSGKVQKINAEVLTSC